MQFALLWGVHRLPLATFACLAACRLGFESRDAAIDENTPRDGARRDGDDDDDDDGDVGQDGSAITCPGSYSMLLGQSGSSRYRVVSNTTDWLAAEAACEADGHHLAIPDDNNELTAFYTALVAQNIWIGVTDRITETTYLRVTGGAATFLDWAPGQPDTDDCAYIDGLTTKLTMQSCGSGRRYICECDGVAADATSY